MKKITWILLLCSLAGWQCTKDAGTAGIANPTGTGASLARFTFIGSYLYTVDEQELKAYSLADPGNPVLRNTVRVGFNIESIFPFGDKLFIGSTSAVYIYSVADPASPQKLGVAYSPAVLRRCDPVVAKDSVAYASLRANGPCGGTQSLLVAYNIQDITKPVQKGSVPVNEPYGLGYSGNVLYVCDRSGLLLYDISSAYDPKLIKTIPGASYTDVIPYGSLLICWISNGMMVYDITDNRNPVLLSKID